MVISASLPQFWQVHTTVFLGSYHPPGHCCTCRVEAAAARQDIFLNYYLISHILLNTIFHWQEYYRKLSLFLTARYRDSTEMADLQ
jgi:hypothetical protein